MKIEVFGGVIHDGGKMPPAIAQENKTQRPSAAWPQRGCFFQFRLGRTFFILFILYFLFFSPVM
ncbi:MAG: hypothetical protein IJ418_04890 [Clostridia bacterium]|nr:hypothetical protein [Clostridia bacterium]